MKVYFLLGIVLDTLMKTVRMSQTIGIAICALKEQNLSDNAVTTDQSRRYNDKILILY